MLTCSLLMSMYGRNPADRYFGAMLGLACGDALGAPVEFLSRSEIEARYGHLEDMVGGGKFLWEPGEWTDDTGMALCVAEGIGAGPDDPIDEIGRRFIEWRRDARDVGATISAAITRAEGQLGERRGWSPLRREASIDWAEASRQTPQAHAGRAAGNGSLMRTLPVALAYPDPTQMLDISARVSAMTHWDPQAETCCAAYCLWIREILCGAEPRPAWRTALDLARKVTAQGVRSADTPGPTPLPEPFWDRLQSAPDLALGDLQPSGYAGYVVECLEAAVWTAVHAESLEEGLVTLVHLGGETDTMAAVAGGALGAYLGWQTIPERWLAVLYQRERLDESARGLYDLRDRRIYSKPSLPRLGFHELEEGLLYGRNPLSAADVEKLQAAGVTRVLDMREDHEWKAESRFGREAVAALAWCGIERVNVPLVDGDAPTFEQLDRIWEYLAQGAGDGSTYIHCRAGIERTGAALAAWLARRDGLSLDEVLDRLGRAEAGLHPRSHQADAVRKWLQRAS